jgi:hypothetical protein
MAHNYLDYSMVVFGKHLYIDIDYQLNNQDKHIDNSMDSYLVLVGMLLNNDKVNLNMKLIYLKENGIKVLFYNINIYLNCMIVQLNHLDRYNNKMNSKQDNKCHSIHKDLVNKNSRNLMKIDNGDRYSLENIHIVMYYYQMMHQYNRHHYLNKLHLYILIELFHIFEND